MRHERGPERLPASESRAGQRTASPVGYSETGSPILRLQASAGNRAVASYLQRMTERPTRVSVQRDELDTDPAAPVPLDGAAPAGAPAKFSDSVNVGVSEVPITVRNNAFDLVNAIQARFGGDGGQTSVTPLLFTPDTDDKGRVTGAQLNWQVQVTVPVIRADPDGPISKPEAAGELQACQALVARIREHENKHAAIEVAGRANFAVTLKGKSSKAVDTALAGLEKAVGKKQRALDNLEGMITLSSSNVVVVSGKDHPEYEGAVTP